MIIRFENDRVVQKKYHYFDDTEVSNFLNYPTVPIIGSENDPLISIVIPSYNQGQFLEDALKSIIHQEYPKVEVIVIDGGSTDSTVSILEKYSSHIHYWESVRDKGQSDALNKGFAIAKGEIFGWLNSDDIYLPGAFLSAVEAFKNNQRVKIVYGDTIWIDKENHVLAWARAIPFTKKHMIYEDFTMSAQAMFWKADLHKAFGCFEIELHRTMDYDMLIGFSLLSEENEFYQIKKAIGAFRRHELQKTRGFDNITLTEHQNIAKRRGLKKYTILGRIRKIQFYLRRQYWSCKLLGFRCTFSRMLTSYKQKLKRLIMRDTH